MLEDRTAAAAVLSSRERPLAHCEGAHVCQGAEALVWLRSRSEAADPAGSCLCGAAPRLQPAPNQAAAGRRSRRWRRRTLPAAMSQLRLKWRASLVWGRGVAGRGARSLVERRLSSGDGREGTSAG